MRLVSYLYNLCATVPKSGRSRDSEPRFYPQGEGIGRKDGGGVVTAIRSDGLGKLTRMCMCVCVCGISGVAIQSRWDQRQGARKKKPRAGSRRMASFTCRVHWGAVVLHWAGREGNTTRKQGEASFRTSLLWVPERMSRSRASHVDRIPVRQ